MYVALKKRMVLYSNFGVLIKANFCLLFRAIELNSKYFFFGCRLMRVRQFLFYPIFLIAFSTLMVLLMWGVYSLPVEKIRGNVRSSAKIVNMTPRRLWYNYDVPGEMIDKNTDARMLNEASILRYKDAFTDSLLNPELIYEWWAPRNLENSLRAQRLDRKALGVYPRFWHGYLIFLKPLSLFLTLEGIRFINLFLQFCLLLIVCYLIYRRLSVREVFAYLTTMLFLNPVTSWMCLEYATDINIMLMASLWVLLNKNKDDDKIFFVTGAVTIAFDFITFPLITLGIPLILHIALYKRELRESIICVIKNSLLWLVAYALMWCLKWGIATVVTGENVFADAWGNIVHRTYGFLPGDYPDATAINLFSVLKLNIGHIYTKISGYYLIGFLVLLLMSFLVQPFGFKKNFQVLIFLLIALMPFVWFCILVNHSIPHYWFTYRILTVSIFAILSAIVCCFREVVHDKK